MSMPIKFSMKIDKVCAEVFANAGIKFAMNFIANNFSNISFSHLPRGSIVTPVRLLLCVNLNCRFAPISGSYLYSKLPIGALIILIW